MTITGTTFAVADLRGLPTPQRRAITAWAAEEHLPAMSVEFLDESGCSMLAELRQRDDRGEVRRDADGQIMTHRIVVQTRTPFPFPA